jgi:hypothetical protein
MRSFAATIFALALTACAASSTHLGQNLGDPTHQEPVFESTILLNAEGEGGTSEAMTAGFVMSGAALLCLDTGEEPKGPPSGLQHAILRGYLIRS